MTRGVARSDHGYHVLRVARVVPETSDAATFVLEIPRELEPAYRYEAGQFCTFRVPVDGTPLVRCYSMSSAPAVDHELRVTVKRVPNGAVSNWMIDNLAAGDEIEVAPPAGFFQLDAGDEDIIAFAGGSGITPVFSVLKTALAQTTRRVRLLYANRDCDSIIFSRDITDLAKAHSGRLEVTHHLDVERGFLGGADVDAFVGDPSEGSFYVCGPAPFMDIVERALVARGVDAGRIHIERFTAVERQTPAGDEASTTKAAVVTVELDGRTATSEHRLGTTILQTARQMGMSPPYSCESGSCATCMARLVEGEATMFVNNALTADEVKDGWVLTCQAVPVTSVHVVYGYEGS